jgi:putative oxidoreductase
MDVGLFLLHLTVGLLFIGHGLQKLTGAFGGSGPDGTARMMESLDMRPPRFHATLAGLGETAGGTLLALGFFTPVGAALVIAVMTTAALTAHAGKGLWSSAGGFEYPLVMATIAFALAAAGPGAWSLDGATGLDLAGAGWAFGALVVGLAGGLGAIAQGRYVAPAPRGGVRRGQAAWR